jgi:hypothetical protein
MSSLQLVTLPWVGQQASFCSPLQWLQRAMYQPQSSCTLDSRYAVWEACYIDVKQGCPMLCQHISESKSFFKYFLVTGEFYTIGYKLTSCLLYFQLETSHAVNLNCCLGGNTLAWHWGGSWLKAQSRDQLNCQVFCGFCCSHQANAWIPSMSFTAHCQIFRHLTLYGYTVWYSAYDQLLFWLTCRKSIWSYVGHIF